MRRTGNGKETGKWKENWRRKGRGYGTAGWKENERKRNVFRPL